MTRPVLPPLTSWLGYAGLLPQAAAVAVLLTGRLEWRFQALAFAFAYAALIFSFLGGLWWGIALADTARAPRWVWPVGVAPSLIALATCLPWMVGDEWPTPSLGLLAVMIALSALVDRRLHAMGLCPPGWLRLRVHLSVGLGALTALASYV